MVSFIDNRLFQKARYIKLRQAGISESESVCVHVLLADSISGKCCEEYYNLTLEGIFNVKMMLSVLCRIISALCLGRIIVCIALFLFSSCK